MTTAPMSIMTASRLGLLCLVIIGIQVACTEAKRSRRSPQIPIAVDPTGTPSADNTTEEQNSTDSSVIDNSTMTDSSITVMTEGMTTALPSGQEPSAEGEAVSSEIPDANMTSGVVDANTTSGEASTETSSEEATTTISSSATNETDQIEPSENSTATTQDSGEMPIMMTSGETVSNETSPTSPSESVSNETSATSSGEETATESSEPSSGDTSISEEPTSSEASNETSSGDDSSDSSSSEESAFDDVEDSDTETEILYSFSDFSLDDNFRQELKMFRTSLELLEALANETATFPDYYKNTTYETMEIDGRLYRLEKTVVKRGDNESSLFFKMVSVLPERKKRFALPGLHLRFKRSNRLSRFRRAIEKLRKHRISRSVDNSRKAFRSARRR